MNECAYALRVRVLSANLDGFFGTLEREQRRALHDVSGAVSSVGAVPVYSDLARQSSLRFGQTSGQDVQLVCASCVCVM